MPKYEYLDDPISEKEWKRILALNIPESLSKFLTFLHSQGGRAVPYREFPEYFVDSHPQQINRWLYSLKMKYHLAQAGGESAAFARYYPDKATLKLFKVKERKAMHRKPKSRKPRKSRASRQQTQDSVPIPHQEQGMRWSDILRDERFTGGVLETIVRNDTLPIVYRGRITAMNLDAIALRVRLSPVMRQKTDGRWEKVEETAELPFDCDALPPEGRTVHQESARVKWTLAECGGGCVVVMTPIPAYEIIPERESCQFAIFYPPRPNSKFERETFAG